MGKRCGCVGKECSCAIRADGTTVFLGGQSGGEGNPISVARSSHAFFQNTTGTATDIGVTGTGVATDPYAITANLSYAGRAPAVSAYEDPGTYTWVKPSAVSVVEVLVIGAGGGGAGGNAASAGSGGQGGGWTRRYVSLSAAVVSATVTVPYGGPSREGDNGYPGGDALVEFKNIDGIVIDTVIAWGGRGGNFTPLVAAAQEPNRGRGMQNGQDASNLGSAPGQVFNWAGGAGGPGNVGTGTSTNLGGYHVPGYSGTGTLRRGGDGGAGATGYTAVQNGSVGYKFGGGGGGGAQSVIFFGGVKNETFGGVGGSGLAVITAL